eukprot:g79768.t1
MFFINIPSLAASGSSWDLVIGSILNSSRCLVSQSLGSASVLSIAGFWVSGKGVLPPVCGYLKTLYSVVGNYAFLIIGELLVYRFCLSTGEEGSRGQLIGGVAKPNKNKEGKKTNINFTSSQLRAHGSTLLKNYAKYMFHLFRNAISMLFCTWESQSLAIPNVNCEHQNLICESQ